MFISIILYLIAWIAATLMGGTTFGPAQLEHFEDNSYRYTMPYAGAHAYRADGTACSPDLLDEACVVVIVIGSEPPTLRIEYYP